MKSLFPGAFFYGVSVGVLAFGLAACTTPNPTALDTKGDVPQTFTAPIQKDAPIWPSPDWWTNFKTDELGSLEVQAQNQNLDIAAAAAQILQAEATNGIAFSALLPTVDVNASASRTLAGGAGVGSASGVARRTFNAFELDPTASYNLDIWGLNQDKLRQAREQLRAARYAGAAVGLTTETDVADEYFTVLALREQIAITHQNIDAAKRILTVTEAKVKSGVSSNLDLAQEQALVANQESTLPGLIEQERAARYALAVLLGRAPEGFDIKAQNLDGIASPAVEPGLPSETLERRPDVAEAEASLYAAHANVDAARAAFFPHIGLSADTGYTSNELSNLINPSNFIWSIGASLLQPIFDGGLLKAESDLAKAQQAQMVASYRKTVFTAFEEVETALSQVAADNSQLDLLTEDVRASAEAFRISELQYREGTIDILALLQTQQTLFTAEISLAQTKLARLEASVNLYASLGGGWDQKSDDAAYKYQLDWWPL